MNLATSYLGLKLSTPLVVSASPLTLGIDNIKRMEDAGAAAVVFQSLFEEQMAGGGNSRVVGARNGPRAYLERIAKAKRSVGIPIIASFNCTTIDGWISYARQVKEAGADALELNIYQLPTATDLPGTSVEKDYIDIVRTVRAATKIPLAVKLSPYFSNLTNMACRLDALGLDALVLFNRFYQPDNDPDEIITRQGLMLSTQADSLLPLRWIGILHGKVRADLAATGGVYRANDVIKMVMAGAAVTMVCSALLREGICHLRTLERGIAEWLEQHGYESLAEIKGMMSQQNRPDRSRFERAQYVNSLATFMDDPSCVA